jgi:uncharacterized protein (DUF1697 family)
VGTHVLFLRGINLGADTAIGMPELRELITRLGHADVRTHLRSGNVVLTAAVAGDSAAAVDAAQSAAGLARQIEDAVTERFGLTAPVVVRTRDELAAAVAANPLPDAEADPARFLVFFLSEAPAPNAIRAVRPDDFRPDQFAVRGRELYQWSPNGVSKTKLTTTFWERRLAVTATARNWNTVTKLLSMLDE